MDRTYKVTVTQGKAKDAGAVIGYDPSLRTFFLQAFMNKRNEFWQGTVVEEFTTLQQLANLAREEGYEIIEYPAKSIIEMMLTVPGAAPTWH